MKKNIVTIKDIRESLYDANLDTEYRKALAHAMMTLEYVTDLPLNLFYGTDKQKEELQKVDSMPLDANQISEIIHLMMYEMRNDFQYGRFKPIANKYISISKENENLKKDNTNIINQKPRCNIYSAYGDMREIIRLVSKTLKENNMYDESREMIEKATLSYDYDEAYSIIADYIEIVKEQECEEEFE